MNHEGEERRCVAGLLFEVCCAFFALLVYVRV